MPATLHASAYRFVTLAEPEAWRAAIRERAEAYALKGTVLLAGEGINLVLAGAAGALRGFLAWLGAQPPFAGLAGTESWSDGEPFGKLVVKVKAEIIRMNRPSVRPASGRAPAVDAGTLVRWLEAGADDAGRPVVTLDTRNAFEVDAGRIGGAIDWRLERFNDFPAAFAAHRSELEGKTVVAYCTGGIRCEKAVLEMAAGGLEHVYQLDGGILRLLEANGASHFEGDCVVFDRRGAVDAQLRPALRD